MYTGAPRKRSRSGDDGDATSSLSWKDSSSLALAPPPSSCHEDKEFWFSDGTVILATRELEFRVYKGLLEDQSPALRDIFAQVHPTHAFPGQLDPCPVVQLSDSSGDVRHVLRAYMPRKQSLRYVSYKPSFGEIAAYIRLGRKYQLTGLYAQALRFLKDHYTPSFDALEDFDFATPPGWKKVEAIGVVNLARLTGELSFFPVALVQCTMLNAEIFQGFICEDGVRETLALRDLGLCFQTKTRIRIAVVAAVLRTFTHSIAPLCTSSESCSSTLQDMIKSLDTCTEDMIAGDPFESILNLVEYGKLELVVCDRCMDMLEELGWEERKDLWKRFPKLLDIHVPRWGEPGHAQEGIRYRMAGDSSMLSSCKTCSNDTLPCFRNGNRPPFPSCGNFRDCW
ncbi:hypothetical protein DICSQDRAFT_63216 [Dichomitus squalens LYAD-421 SS1]|uniref:BTB domain-containing protein n=1 Tax=Dichomitus squalens (strain LYAD-421) TaxID=732165 RepID=R7SVN8_DICSQ|nr:uncharacterized protein DICSQDRAFT_63216 [Dichomitus squalens LYAD-421 SS1]EJF60249.1 hypothetical protein DICSQDRAFT_63216 [Dichomitus squalens LYAD-421 SS1]